jgi:hypothetical protein
VKGTPISDGVLLAHVLALFPRLSAAWPSWLLATLCLALFDLTSGYWQFPLDPSCWKFFSYITDRGIFTPTRVPQGAVGSVAYIQAMMCHVLGDELLYKNAIPWIDDVLIWANSDEELVESLRKLFEQCKSFGLKLHAKKS